MSNETKIAIKNILESLQSGKTTIKTAEKAIAALIKEEQVKNPIYGTSTGCVY